MKHDKLDAYYDIQTWLGEIEQSDPILFSKLSDGIARMHSEGASVEVQRDWLADNLPSYGDTAEERGGYRD